MVCVEDTTPLQPQGSVTIANKIQAGSVQPLVVCVDEELCGVQLVKTVKVVVGHEGAIAGVLDDTRPTIGVGSGYGDAQARARTAAKQLKGMFRMSERGLRSDAAHLTLPIPTMIGPSGVEFTRFNTDLNVSFGLDLLT